MVLKECGLSASCFSYLGVLCVFSLGTLAMEQRSALCEVFLYVFKLKFCFSFAARINGLAVGGHLGIYSTLA